MERVVGPIDGFYAAIFARELDGQFRASYKVCTIRPADYRSAVPVRHKRVDGVAATLPQAFAIAEQLARLQIVRLRDRLTVRQARAAALRTQVDFDTSAGDHGLRAGSGSLYAPTQPCPLYE